jgi:hypothetical protein
MKLSVRSAMIGGNIRAQSADSPQSNVLSFGSNDSSFCAISRDAIVSADFPQFEMLISELGSDAIAQALCS